MQTNSNTRKCFEHEKQAYWAMREELLKQYKGKWVAIINGRLAAVGEKRGKVMADAYQKTKSKIMFVSEVGYEKRVLRIRQISTGLYNQDYEPDMPMKMTPVSDIAGDVSIDANFVIDTGADLTVLKNDLAVQLNLYDAPAGMSYVSGVGAEPIQRQLYGALVSLANQKIMIAVDCRDDCNENLMGRDVINEFALTLCAKRKIVQFEWIPDEMRHE